jgi:AAA domain
MSIPKREAELEALFAKHFSNNHNETSGANGQRQHSNVDLADDEIIAKARKAKNSAKFERLFDNGDISEYDHDDSRADLALMSIFAFYSQDHDQLDRLFTRSALCRYKYLKRPDYRRRTIEAAIKGLAETSRVSSPSPPNRENDDDDDAAPANVVWLHQVKDPGPRRFLVEDVVPEKYPTVIYGGGGTMKSLIALQLAIVVALGLDEWLGLKVNGTGPVMYFDLELDAEEQRRRVRDLAAGLGKPIPENLCYLSGLGMPTRKAFTLALESCKRHGVRLLILDSLGPAMLGDAKKAGDVIGFHNDYIAPFREAGVTVVIIDHQGKLQAGESYQHKTSFGSAYKEHLVRSVIQVEAGDRNREAGTVTITVRPKKASFGPRRNPFAVRLTFEEEKITAEPDELDETELATEGTLNAEDRVKLALRSGPAYSDELADRTELALGTVQNSITRLKKRGKVEPTGEKRGSAEQVRLTSSSSFPL